MRNSSRQGVSLVAQSPRKDREIVPFSVGDKVVLRKPHPCGSNAWDVFRIGADIGLSCSGCGRRVMLERPLVQRRMKSRIPADVGRGEPSP